MFSKAFYEFLLRPFTVLLMNMIWVRKVYGTENIPKTGPVILAANHSSFLDFLIIPSILKRRVRIVAAKELTKRPMIGWYARNDGCILVDRNNPGTQYYKDSVNTLNNNTVLLVFPEGTRSEDGSLHMWKRGFVKLAIHAHAPIVPVAIKGTYENLPKNGKIRFNKTCKVKFGKPVDLSRYFGKKISKDELNTIANGIHDQVSDMLKTL
jgi:1-acyl-sn-glycerol-3-phosphate acyltransferase